MVLYEKVGNEYEVFYQYDADGRLSFLIYVTLSTGTKNCYSVVTNAQGDVVKLLDGQGNGVVSYAYDAWGNITLIMDSTSINIGSKNSIRYRGYVYDTETGLYYLQSRYYDPQTGRFISSDQPEYIGANDDFGGWNGFGYCENEPVDWADFDGKRKVKNAINGKKNGACFTGSYYALNGSRNGNAIYNLSIKIEKLDLYANYNNGVLKIWNGQQNIIKAFENNYTQTFAYALKKLSRKIRGDALKGRTVDGLAFELLVHYVCFAFDIKTSRTEVTDCGALKKDNYGYDSNAYVFEQNKGKLNTLQALITNKCYPSALAFISPVLIKFV